MNPNTSNRAAAMDAFRMRAMQRSPVPTQGATPQPSQGATPGGASPNMSAGGVQQLKQSQPDEATIIIKALIQRLKSLSEPQGGSVNAAV